MSRSRGSAANPTLAHRIRHGTWSATRVLVMFGVAAAIVIPLAYAAISGFRDTGEIRNRPVDLPSDWFPHKYIEILTGEMYWRELLNSIIVAVAITVLAGAHNALAGFAFCKLRFRGRRTTFALLLSTMMLPYQVYFIFAYILCTWPAHKTAGNAPIPHWASDSYCRAAPSFRCGCPRNTSTWCRTRSTVPSWRSPAAA